jgi:hypothetical protein
MKKYILKEQTTDTIIVNAPSDELRLLNQDIFKGKGNLVNLGDQSGNPVRVQVGGKIYTAGIRTQKGNYIVYDGRILTYTDKGFRYLTTPSGKIGMVQGSVDKNLTNAYLQKLAEFGIENVKNLYSVLDQAREYMQKIIDNGAVGNVFRDFNEVLAYYYPTDNTKRLTSVKDQPIDRNVLGSQYDQKNLSNIGLNGSYYLPKGVIPQLSGQKLEFDEEKCRDTLKKYLIFAVQSQATGINTLTNEDRQNYKRAIKTCKGLGSYDKQNFEPFTQGELDFQVAKEFNKFNLLNKRLTYREISKILGNINQRWTLLESKETTMDNKIKKVLNEQLIKQKRLVTERKIVENRIKLLVESYNLKNYKNLTESQKTKISFLILKEMSFLSKENLVNEQFTDFLKSIFGNLLPSGIETIGEKIVVSILDKLGLKDSYFKNFLVSFFTTNPAKLIEALKDCKTLTKIISQSLVEAMVMQIQGKYGAGDQYRWLRNLLGDVIKDQPFVQKIEETISASVCDTYNKLSGNAKSVLNTLGGGSAAQLTQ